MSSIRIKALCAIVLALGLIFSLSACSDTKAAEQQRAEQRVAKQRAAAQKAAEEKAAAEAAAKAAAEAAEREAAAKAAAEAAAKEAAAKAAAEAAAPEPPVRDIWKAGDMTVTIIQDMPGTMAVELFSGPASEQERLQYFTNGVAEAGFNVFLLRAGGKNVLFDTGLGTMRQTPGRLWELLAGLGSPPEAVDLVLLTHMHGDHIGGLMQGAKKAFPKAKILVAKAELEFWLNLAEKEPGNANAAMVKAIAEAYGADMQLFAYGDTLLPGVTALNAAGHTPGHTVFQLEADGKTLLIIGDLIHSAPLQFALPGECARFDMHVPLAVADRKRFLELAAEKNLHIAGMHLPFPGIGTVLREGQGYKLVQE